MLTVGIWGAEKPNGRGVRGLSLVLGFALATGLAGCKKSEKNASLVCDRDAYIFQSGEFRAEDGEELATIGEGEGGVVNGEFEKPYDRGWLKAVGRASIPETIRYVEGKGAKVYRAEPISPKSTLNLSAAAVLPEDLHREWTRADQPIAGSECGFITGVYFGAGTRGLFSARRQAAIIVREDAGRWTLVHEFMHHNFKTQATERGYDDDLAQSVRMNLTREIDELEKDRTISMAEYSKRFSSLFQQLIDAADQILVQYHLEEIAIEALLQERYEKGELAFVPSASYANAMRYMEIKRDQVKGVYDGLTGLYDKAYRLVVTNGPASDRRKLERFVTLRDHRLAQIDKVIAKRKAHGFSAPLAAMASVGESPEAPEQLPCARASAAEGDLKRIIDRMSRIP